MVGEVAALERDDLQRHGLGFEFRVRVWALRFKGLGFRVMVECSSGSSCGCVWKGSTRIV